MSRDKHHNFCRIVRSLLRASSSLIPKQAAHSDKRRSVNRFRARSSESLSLDCFWRAVRSRTMRAMAARVPSSLTRNLGTMNMEMPLVPAGAP